MYNKIMKKRTLYFFIYSIFCCALYISVIYFFQYNFLFHPETNYRTPQNANTPEFVESPLITKDKTQIMTWFFQGDRDKPLILFFHGNSGQLSKYSPMLTKLVQNKYSVAMLEYRGFGNTKGELSRENIFSDAIEFYDYYKSKTNNKILFYGYSFGCAVAIGLSQFRKPDGIILTAPFVSFYQEVKDKYYIPFAYCFIKHKYRFNNYIIKNLALPVIFIHGKKDSLISYKHSKKLFELSPSKEKEIHLLANTNHHDIFFKDKNIQTIQDWLKNF